MDELKRALTVFFLLLAAGAPAPAETLYAPQACPASEMNLKISHRGQEAGEFWLQIHEGSRLKEVNFQIAARSEMRLSMSDLLGEQQSVVVKHHEKSLQVLMTCNGQLQMNSITSPRLDFQLPFGGGSQRLLIQNLDPSAKRGVTLRYLNRQGAAIETSKVFLSGPYTTQEFSLTPPAGAQILRLDGEARLSAQLVDARSGRAAIPRVREAATAPASGAMVYFLVQRERDGDSYVISLDPVRQAELVQEARQIVREKKAMITIAEIEPARGISENRDFSSLGSSPWSWKVRQVEAFTEIARDHCTGSPSYVEEWYHSWMARPVRTICFWGYFLQRELSADEIRQGAELKTRP